MCGLSTMAYESAPPPFMALVRSPSAQGPSTVDAALAQWQGVTAALAPIVGQRGVLGLFRRSLALSQPAHPHLGAVCAAVHPADDLQSLRAALLPLPPALAAAAHEALMQTFVALLGNLIGAELGAQLIGDSLTAARRDCAAETSPS